MPRFGRRSHIGGRPFVMGFGDETGCGELFGWGAIIFLGLQFVAAIYNLIKWFFSSWKGPFILFFGIVLGYIIILLIKELKKQ